MIFLAFAHVNQKKVNVYAGENKVKGLDSFIHEGNIQPEDRTYIVGVVPQYDVWHIKDVWMPILKAISEKTGIKLDLRISPAIPIFENALSAGEFDIAYMNPYHLIVANKDQGYVPILRDVAGMLYGIIVVRKDSPIKKVEDLDGKG